VRYVFTILQGVPLNAVDIAGQTALHYAVHQAPRCMKLVEKLLASGADVNIRNDFGLTPLMLAWTYVWDLVIR